MSFSQASAIRQAITELLRGSSGTTRIVPQGLFEPGVFAGQKPAAQQSKAIDHRYVHRFDISISRQAPNAATPMGASNSPHRISDFTITINITTRLKAVTRDDAREEQRSQIEGDCDLAVQALNRTNNLDSTLDAHVTGIVSGLLRGPGGLSTPVWELVEENWEQHLLRSRIVAEAIVIQQQAVA